MRVAEPTPQCVASDLIEYDGRDLRDLPLIDRKQRLAELIGKAMRLAVSATDELHSQKLDMRICRRSRRERSRETRYSRMRRPLLMKG